MVAAGDSLPDVNLLSKPGMGLAKSVNIKEYAAGKKIILMGLPGAFTPC